MSSEVWIGLLLLSALKWQNLANFLKAEQKILETGNFYKAPASWKTFSLTVKKNIFEGMWGWGDCCQQNSCHCCQYLFCYAPASAQKHNVPFLAANSTVEIFFAFAAVMKTIMMALWFPHVRWHGTGCDTKPTSNTATFPCRSARGSETQTRQNRVSFCFVSRQWGLHRLRVSSTTVNVFRHKNTAPKAAVFCL